MLAWLLPWSSHKCTWPSEDARVLMCLLARAMSFHKAMCVCVCVQSCHQSRLWSKRIQSKQDWT